MENNYKEYLESYAWKALKQVKLSEQPDCECCGERATTVHHLSYERRGSEREEDIVSICERCHHECHLVNGYQIKNDEDTLRKRFEEVREEYGGNNYNDGNKYEVNKNTIYINGIILESLGFGLYTDGTNVFYYSYVYNSDDSYWEEEKYYNTLGRADEYKEKYGDGPENDGSYYPEYDGDYANSSYEENENDEETDINNECFGVSLFSKYKSDLVFQDQDGGNGRSDSTTINKFRKLSPSDIEIIGEIYIKVKNDVLYYESDTDNFYIIEGCHAGSFEIMKNNYAKDKNFSYKDGKRFTTAEGDNLTIINDYFAEDGKYVYCLREKSHFPPFKSSVFYTEKTKVIDKYIIYNNNFYEYSNEFLRNIEGLDNLDIESIKFINYFVKDKNNVYYRKNNTYALINGVNSSYFEIINEDFAKDDKYIIYFYKNYKEKNFPLEYKILTGIDINSFKVINKEFVQDKNFVYFIADNNSFILVNGINSHLFEIPTIFSSSYHGGYGNKIFKSEKYVYYYNSDNKTFNLLKGADPGTIQNIFGNYSKDKYSVYFKEDRINFANPESFEKINNYITKDKNNVYYENKILNGADIKTFESLGYYSKDKNNVYYEDKILNGADIKTFEVLDYGYSKDKNNVYYEGEKMDICDVNSFQVLGWEYYSKDKNIIYHKGKILEGFDKKTFTEVYKEDKHSLFMDKNHLFFIDGNRGNKLNIIENFDGDSFKLISKYTKKSDDWSFQGMYKYGFEGEDNNFIYNIFNHLYTYERRDSERNDEELIINIEPKIKN